jgi:hypothetical protein
MVDKDHLAADSPSFVSGMVGKEVWGFAVGANTGSHVSFQIGGKIPTRLLYKKQNKNPYLSVDQRFYDAEISLYVRCAWRIANETSVLCGGWDDLDDDGPKMQTLKSLVGCFIERATVSLPAFDLQLRFSNDLELSIFCDSMDEAEDEDNYRIHFPSEIWAVGARSKLQLIKEEGRMELLRLLQAEDRFQRTKLNKFKWR